MVCQGKSVFVVVGMLVDVAVIEGVVQAKLVQEPLLVPLPPPLLLVLPGYHHPPQ